MGGSSKRSVCLFKKEKTDLKDEDAVIQCSHPAKFRFREGENDRQDRLCLVISVIKTKQMILIIFTLELKLYF